ncbi:MAG: hypothetical protein P1U36_00280 [Legionellaceae bacterium]|nr:hypothetical protein [Legionellaceae bacterium]
MKTIPITANQSANACTLISLGVIKAILQLDEITNEHKLKALITKTHQDCIKIYQQDRQSNPSINAGYLEHEAYRDHFNESLNISTRQEVSVQTDTSIDALIAYFTSNREAFQDTPPPKGVA